MPYVINSGLTKIIRKLSKDTEVIKHMSLKIRYK